MIDLQWHSVPVEDDKPYILTAIRPEEIEALCKLAAGNRVLEIGGAHGYSAIMMARARAKEVISIDDHNGKTWLGDTLKIMAENISTFAPAERINIIPELDSVALPRLYYYGEKFDLVFVDGGETFSSIWLDIGYGQLLLNKGGTIAVHDYDHSLYPEKKVACDLMWPDGPTELVTTLFVKQL